MALAGAKEATLGANFTVQARIIRALLIREMMTRYGRHNIGFLWLFVEPMMFVIVITAVWTALRDVHGSNIPISAFALTGYSSVLLWRNMVGRCIGALQSNISQLYHRNIKVFDIYLARILLEFAGTTMSFTMLSVLFIALEWTPPPEDVLQVAGGWLILAWIGASLSTCLGALSHESELVRRLWTPASLVLFIISGAAFLVDALPPSAQHYVLFNPIIHGVEFVREGYFGSKFRAHYDLAYVIPVCMALSVLALIQVRKLSARVVPQ